MFRRRAGMDTKTILKRIAEGRGQGTGQNYKGWITTQEFSSQGQRNREFGFTTGRQHDYLSIGELNYHYVLDWAKTVVDIQEQFPLLSHNPQSPLEDTLAIARQCCIPHPADRKTKDFVPLTTDFLITLMQPIGVIKVARTVKPTSALLDKRKYRRIIEKFEIERRFWKARGIRWSIITEKELALVLVLVENIMWIHKFRGTSALHPLAEESVQQIARALTEMVSQSNAPLCEVALSCDARLGLETGCSLTVARYLIGTRQWLVDMMNKSIHATQKLELLRVALTNASPGLGKAVNE